METINSIEQNDFNAKPFKIVYIILFAVILIVDMIFIILLFTIWANLEEIKFVFTSQFNLVGDIIMTSQYFLFLFSPILKVIFEIYEVTRFSRFLMSNNQDKESAINIARGFKGTRIYRIYYLLLMAGFILWYVLLENSYFINPTGHSAYLRFSFRFAILLLIHLLLLIMGPRIIKFSIDYKNKKKRNMIIFDLILWTIILNFILYFVLYYNLFIQFLYFLKFET